MWIYAIGALLSAFGLNDLYGMYSQLTDPRQYNFLSSDDRFIVTMMLIVMGIFAIFCGLCILYFIILLIDKIRNLQFTKRRV